MSRHEEVPGGPLAETGFDELLREVLQRVHGALDERARWELLLDAVVTMAAELSLDELLSRIVAIASQLVDAQYAALGVLGNGRSLRTFVHHGFSDDLVTQIGPLPTGHGLLGLIIDHPEPLRLHDLGTHPASYGFPAHHPPMHSFLGVPVRIRDRVFGNLYLTEKSGGGDFTEQDERIVVALATAAGVAIENATLSEQAAERERWLSATAEISTRLARSVTGLDALQTVADRARDVAGADVAWVVAGPDDAHLSVRAIAGAEADLIELAALSLEHSLAREVVRSGEPIGVDDMGTDQRATALDSVLGWPVLGPVIVVPMLHANGIEGVLALGWTPDRAPAYGALDASLPGRFAEQAALALQVVRSREDQQRLAVFEDRDRIGRDLHDLVIQRLFAIGLSLQGASRLTDIDQARPRLETAVDDIDATIRDIRRTIFALSTPDGAADLQSELGRLVDRAQATLKFRPSLRVRGPVRSLVGEDLAGDVLAVLAEALSNVARHAHASAVEIDLVVGETLVLTVVDDGEGVPGRVVEGGLRNLRERAERRGGNCVVTSEEGHTVVCWRVPIA